MAVPINNIQVGVLDRGNYNWKQKPKEGMGMCPPRSDPMADP